MKIPESKVYCCDCKHYKNLHMLSSPKHCQAPGNVGDFYSPHTGFNQTPCERNKYNNCGLFTYSHDKAEL